MEPEQTAPAESASVEQRLANFFAAPEVAPAEEESASTEQVEVADTEQHEPEQTEPDGEEFEVDGATYKLPAPLKAKIQEWKDSGMRTEDYTRKTQELAALTKHVSTIADVANARQQFEQTIAEERGELAQVQSQLNSFKAVDWNSIDADVAQRLFFQREQLKEKAKELEGRLGAKGEQFRQWSESKKREVLQHGQRYLEQSINGWGREAQGEVVKAAQELGYTSTEIETVLDPRLVRALYESAQYRKLLAGRESAVKTAQKAPPVIKPGVKSTETVTTVKDKGLRDRLRKSGDMRDFAAVLANRMR